MVPIRETRKKKYILTSEKKKVFHEMLHDIYASLIRTHEHVYMKTLFEDEDDAEIGREIFIKKPGLFRRQRLLLAFYQWDRVLLKIWDESIQDFVRKAVLPYSNIPDLGLEEITIEHTYTYRNRYAPKEIGALSLSETTGGELSEASQNGALALTEGKK